MPASTRPLPQDLRAKAVKGAEGGLYEAFQRIFETGAHAAIEAFRASPVESFAQADLQLAGSLVSEGNRDNALHRSAGGQHAHDTAHQFRGLARTRGGFHDEALPKRIANAFAGGIVVGQSYRRHGIFLRSCSVSSASRRFFAARDSWLGPQTGR